MNKIAARWIMLAAILLFGQNAAAWCALGHGPGEHAPHALADEQEHDSSCRLCTQLGNGTLPVAATSIGAPAVRASEASGSVPSQHAVTVGTGLPGARAPPRPA